MKISNRPRFPKKEIENRTFWQKHINAQEKSGLSKLNYCQQNEVDYERFYYWLRKEKTDISKKPLMALNMLIPLTFASFLR